MNYNYRALLKKYIEYIGDCEGTTFLDNELTCQPFTQEEWDELKRIADEPWPTNSLSTLATRGGMGQMPRSHLLTVS